MARPLRRFQQGECQHVINRGNTRSTLFFDDADYQVFLDLLADAIEKFELPLLGYCLMRNHWHLVVLPGSTSELSRAMHWMTTTHTRRWCRAHRREGPGHVYQGRFWSAPIQPGISLCRVLRYVERNALRAGLVSRAEAWPWSSAHQRHIEGSSPRLLSQPFLAAADWLDYINQEQLDDDIAAAIRRNLPIGSEQWARMRREKLKLPEPGRTGRPWS